MKGLVIYIHACYMHVTINFINRKNPNNILLAALWFSTEKPYMNTFLQPVIEMLLDLESTGW